MYLLGFLNALEKKNSVHYSLLKDNYSLKKRKEKKKYADQYYKEKR